ncbi:MAG: class I SAM-dependent methyltransferase [Rhodovibrionaceae bacterium]|nr:class I SAM-dependent methyltransferase [Rhodovibrionaceae bacterium]
MSDKSVWIDEGQKLRYNLDTQDEAYRTGAYDYILDIGMAPRMATIAAYLRHYGARSVLDIGCGSGPLLPHLPPDMAYVGIDISETAVAEAKRRFGDRPGETHFHVGDFRDFVSPIRQLDAVVWAGIGRTWTKQGKGGDRRDWLEILGLAEAPLRPDGLVIFELVTPHCAALQEMIPPRYEYLVGCDIDHLEFGARGQRSIRVYRRRAAP